MTKALLSLLVLFNFFLNAKGQPGNLILTYTQNNNWFDSLSTLSLGGKLKMINDRLLPDTNIFVRQRYADRIKVVDQIGNRVYGDGKPTIIVNNKGMLIDNKTEPKKIIGLTRLLNINYIADITLLKGTDPATTAVYGSQGENGVIIMILTKRKFIKKFKQLKLTSNY
jgi:hypothetical protein